MPLSHVVFSEMSKFELEVQRDRTNINLDRTINAGNGRRLMGMPTEKRNAIPSEIAIKDTPTTHEITLTGTGASSSDGYIMTYTNDYTHDGRAYVKVGPTTYECRGNLPANGKQSSIDAYMCHIGRGEELVGRTRHTKIICTKDEGQPRRFFYVMVWSDFFGASVKEGELARRSKTSRTFYTREEVNPDKVRMLSESVTNFLDQFAPKHPNQAAPEINPDWLTSTVLALVDRAHKYDQSVYPILADALQDAGCDDEEMLTHFRDPEIHHHANCWWMAPFYKIITAVPEPAAAMAS